MDGPRKDRAGLYPQAVASNFRISELPGDTGGRGRWSRIAGQGRPTSLLKPRLNPLTVRALRPGKVGMQMKSAVSAPGLRPD